MDESTQALVLGTSQVRTHLYVCMVLYEPLVNLQVVGTEVTSDAVLSVSEIVPIFTKAKTQPQFAALLVERLIDETS